jgi:hypothetical protein
LRVSHTDANRGKRHTNRCFIWFISLWNCQGHYRGLCSSARQYTRRHSHYHTIACAIRNTTHSQRTTQSTQHHTACKTQHNATHNTTHNQNTLPSNIPQQLFTVQWPDKPRTMTFDSVLYGNRTYSVGDHVYLNTGDEESAPFIAQIQSLFVTDDGRNMLRAKWYFPLPTSPLIPF